LLRAAATETLGDDPEPRSGLMEVVNQLSGAAEILESMTPRQFRES
jgi:hypothetical protein